MLRSTEAETARRGRFGWGVHVAAVGAGGERADHPAGVGVASLLQQQAAARWHIRPSTGAENIKLVWYCFCPGFPVVPWPLPELFFRSVNRDD